MHNFARKQSLIANWLSQFTPTGKFWVRSNISLLLFYKNKLCSKVSNQNRITCHFSERVRTSFFPYFGQFLPFYPICGPKSQFSNNEKNTWRYQHFTYVQQKSQLYQQWLLAQCAGKLFPNIGPFLFFLPQMLQTGAKYQNFQKIKKTPKDIIILHMCSKNRDHIMYG